MTAEVVNSFAGNSLSRLERVIKIILAWNHQRDK